MNYHVYMSTKPFRFVEVINSIILFIYLKKIYDLWHNKKRLQGRNVTPKNSIMRSRHGVTIWILSIYYHEIIYNILLFFLLDVNGPLWHFVRAVKHRLDNRLKRRAFINVSYEQCLNTSCPISWRRHTPLISISVS